MATVITLAQLKGGVGKTTLAVAIAAELARRGASAALIDSDPQGSAVQWALPGQLPCPVSKMPLEGIQPEAWVRQTKTVTADYIVIDSAPNTQTIIAPIAIATVTLVPCTPSGLDLEGTVRTLHVVDSVRRRWPQRRCVIVPNRVDSRTLEGRQFVDELERFGEPVSPSVGNRVSFVRAFANGQAVSDLEPGGAAAHEVHHLCDFLRSYLA